MKLPLFKIFVPTGQISRRLWAWFTVAAIIFTLLFTQKLAGLPFRKTFRRPAPDDGSGIAAHLRLPAAYPQHPWAYRFVRVYENGKPLPHRIPANRGTAEQGNGCYQAKGNVVWFVGSDGSDPRKNGRDYKATGPRLVPAWAFWLSAGATAALAAGLLACRVTRMQFRRAVKATRDWLESPPSFCPVKNSVPQPQEPGGSLNPINRICRIVSRFLPLVLAIPSITILATLPPLWKDIDGVIQVASEAGPTVILHFPPLYCFASRLPILAGETAAWLVAGGPLPEWNLAGKLMPTDAGVYCLLICQHILLWLVLAKLIRTCTRSPRVQTFLAAVVLTFAPFYTIANCVGSEAAALLLQILFIIVCIKLTSERASRLLWIGFIALLCANILTRHINAVLAMVLPSAFAISAFLTLLRRKQAGGSLLTLVRHAKMVALSILAGVMGIVTANLTLRILCFACETEYRSEYGQTIADRVGVFLQNIPKEEGKELESAILSRSEDPGTREAIRSLAEVGTYYGGAAKVVGKLIEDSEHQHWEIRDVEVTKRFNDATLLYLKSMHPKLIGLILFDFNQGFYKRDVSDLAWFPFEAHLWTYHMIRKKPDYPTWNSLSRLHSFNPADEPVLENWRHTYYPGIYRNVTPAWIFAAACLLSIVAVVRSPSATGKSGLALALMASGIVGFFLNMILVFYLVRYAMPMFLMGAAAIFLTLGALFEPALSPSQERPEK